MRRLLLTCLLLVGLIGCNVGDRSGTGLLSRHQKDDLKREFVPTCNKPILEAARAVTEFEDGLRRDGTITVKTPDVWGDSNLMHSIQEFDKELKGSIGGFTETLQAAVVVTDAAGVSVQTEVTAGLDGATASAPPASNLSMPEVQKAFEAVKSLSSLVPDARKISLEPTQRERQHATYVGVNQQLRRRAMGGDNTRKAGYGLYLFRIPVSILPGEETTQGYSAVANIRARMVTTQADVKYTLPRMAIADLVEALTEGILKKWDSADRSASVEAEIKKSLEKLAKHKEEETKEEKTKADKKKAADKKSTFKVEVACVEDAIADLAKIHKTLSDEELDAKFKGINMLYEQAILRQTVLDLRDKKVLTPQDAKACLKKLRNPLPERNDLEQQLSYVKNIINRAKRLADAIDCYNCLVSDESGTPIDLSKLGKDARKALLNKFLGKTTELSKSDYEKLDNAVSQNGAWAARTRESIGPVYMQDFMVPLSSPGFDPFLAPAFIAPTQAESTGIAQLSVVDFGDRDIVAVRDLLKSRFQYRLGSKPQSHELRTMLFDLLQQTNIQLEKMDAYDFTAEDGSAAILAAASALELGRDIEPIAADWRNQLMVRSQNSDHTFLRTAWLLARQCGLVDLNIKRMMREMKLRGEVTEQEVAAADFINFFGNCDLVEAKRIWQMIVESEFPLQVFTLEPLVEEQNLLDASSRLRQMQVALAVSVAQGSWNARQRVELSRQLAKESAAIGLNRTRVGFAHGDDTFGWYFHPRVQSPDTPIRNGRVFGQILKSTGPSRKDDLRTYRLEPGVRECEVLVAMPSFVSQVEFDVTTNWESLASPGRSKRSYEELIQEGCKLQKMMACLDSAFCGPECRPGDLARLQSRAKQLEKMLGMQTHRVTVPYEYDQPATELFDQGDRELVPTVNGFYGLSTLIAKDEKDEFTADFFITGRNFHPTLTHVVVAGHESHSDETDSPKVEILSRELIRVQTSLKTDKLAGDSFEVRVGTPGGLSNPLSIPKAPVKKDDPKSAFDWAVQPKLTVSHRQKKDDLDRAVVNVQPDNGEEGFKIKSSAENLIDISKYRNKDLKLKGDAGYEMRIVYDITFKDGKKRKIKGNPTLIPFKDPIDRELLREKIRDDLQLDKKEEEDKKQSDGLRVTDPPEGTITGTTYIRLDNFPLIKFDTKIEIKLEPTLSARKK